MKKSLLLILTAVLLTSCVTKKQFTELADKYDDLTATNSDLISENDELFGQKNSNSKKVDELVLENDELENELKQLEQELKSKKVSCANLQESYDLLASKSSSALSKKAKENQELLNDLDDKETKLFQEQANLNKLRAALSARSKRIEDLEALIASKEAAMQSLKNSISHALKSFEGKGLTVEQRNGKVYVSMENKLLFAPGKWAVGKNGTSAIQQLAKVLVKNPTIEVLIEGHTDNDPYKNGGVIEDNWDLSVKRATAIVRILQSKNVSTKQLTAAGRGEYIPVASNATNSGKAKNRRIEIVLSPNLDEVNKLLNEQ
ncbi:OmpA family protein [Flavobacteriaceae bacterium]|nr:OmpA family protein [Flavobacteriaceae bacterium]